MNNEPFGRQPKPVQINFHGSDADCDYYMKWITRIITNASYDNVVRTDKKLMIYPGAVND